MTSKYGFSVVAPIRTSVPSSTAGQQRVLLRLVEAVDLVEEEDGRAAAAQALLARGRSPRARPCCPTCTADSSSNAALACVATSRASVVFPVPGRPVEDHRVRAPLLDRAAQHRALAQHVLLADDLAQRAPVASARPAARSGRRRRAALRARRRTGSSGLRPWSSASSRHFHMQSTSSKPISRSHSSCGSTGDELVGRVVVRVEQAEELRVERGGRRRDVLEVQEDAAGFE